MKADYLGQPSAQHKPQSKSVWVVVSEAGWPLRTFVTRTAAEMYAGGNEKNRVVEYVPKS